MIRAMQKPRFIPDLASLGFFILALPVTVAIAGGIWLAAAAAYENVKFVRCTDQLLSIIGFARDDAAMDAEFGQTSGEDLLDDLVRRAQFMGPPVNSWGGELRVVAWPLPYMRIETELPVRACRRLAHFFGKDANALKLQKMDARDEKGVWHSIYDAAGGTQMFDYQLINTACGGAKETTLSITLRLR
jgi:hypothetical protein